MTKQEKRIVEKLANDLATAFTWADTPQKEDYWLQVSENLYELANDDDEVNSDPDANAACDDDGVLHEEDET